MDAPGKSAPALRVEDLRKSFEDPEGGRRPVVDVARFEIDAGEQVALAGGSGTGKTTLLHLIAGIVTPDGGRVEVAGVEVTALGESRRDRWRGRSLGYVFQTFQLLMGLSALENVEIAMQLVGRSDRKRARGLLERVGLGDRLHHRPAQLSVGQQQRVAVARALANAPALVLADEPTGSLDPVNGQRALGLIRDACREEGAALLLVSHDRDVLASFERREDLVDINRACARVRGAS